MWYGNYASRHSKEEQPTKSANDSHGHPTSSRSWTAKSTCGHHFSDCVSDEQKKLSISGEKDIGKYHAALAHVFDRLTESEHNRCEEDAVEWNMKPLPDEIQQWSEFIQLSSCRLLTLL